MNNDLLQRHMADIQRIGRVHGAIRLRVFGSRTTGRNNEFSDLDLLVDLEEGRDLLDLIGMKQDLESLLGCEVDVVTEGSLSPYLRDKIMGEARPL